LPLISPFRGRFLCCPDVRTTSTVVSQRANGSLARRRTRERERKTRKMSRCSSIETIGRPTHRCFFFFFSLGIPDSPGLLHGLETPSAGDGGLLGVLRQHGRDEGGAPAAAFGSRRQRRRRRSGGRRDAAASVQRERAAGSRRRRRRRSRRGSPSRRQHRRTEERERTNQRESKERRND